MIVVLIQKEKEQDMEDEKSIRLIIKMRDTKFENIIQLSFDILPRDAALMILLFYENVSLNMEIQFISITPF